MAEWLKKMLVYKNLARDNYQDERIAPIEPNFYDLYSEADEKFKFYKKECFGIMSRIENLENELEERNVRLRKLN